MAPSILSTASRPSSSAPDAVSSGIFSRFRSSWSPSPPHRHRVLAEYYIEPDDPYRHYAPGDIVRGAVVLTVTKPIRVTHLVVGLHGCVRVFRSGLDRKGRVRAASTTTDEAEGEGFRSIFQDEMVLCGEGRLERGTYCFNFELEFSRKRLPSSIDFERGTISYTITSTLTRPTTVGPTNSCDRKIHLVETIDVGLLDAPTPQMIVLARTRWGKSKSAKRENNAHSSKASLVGPDGDMERASTPALSEFSIASTSTVSDRPEAQLSSLAPDVRGSPGRDHNGKAVRATVELSRGGCLPGGILTVKINVDHITPIRSLHGVIVTFYRQSRIDPHPWDGDGRQSQSKSDYYYPKSKTGLRALSLSAPGLVRKYRMDLCQTVSPLIVNPQTLHSTVQASIRVHDDVFPTISCVPGDMISFKYFVEVVLDLKGNLPSQDRLVAHLGVAQSAAEYATSTEHGGSTSTWVGSVVDTERLRREKSVVARTFEVVIGTKDSSRGTKRILRVDETVEHPPITAAEVAGRQSLDEVLGMDELVDDAPDYSSGDEGIFSSILHPPSPVDDFMDEKTRVRQAEERLLPSRPPGLDDDDSHSTPGPSAPTVLEDLEEQQQQQPPTSLSIPPSAPALEDIPSSSSLSEDLSNSPTTAVTSTSTSRSTFDFTEDKQELERRRLQAAASAPGDDHDDDDEERPLHVSLVPSAPVLSDADDEQLPSYGPQ